MGKRSDRAHPGETGHAEGQHGEKTHRAFIEQLQTGSRDQEVEELPMRSDEGRHRLAEAREQRDEAERNSEANRKRAEIGRGRLDPASGVGDRINGDAGH